jgi:hypothetical protein
VLRHCSIRTYSEFSYTKTTAGSYGSPSERFPIPCRRDPEIVPKLSVKIMLELPISNSPSRGLNPPASASHSCVWRQFASCASQARKSPLFAHPILSPRSRIPIRGAKLPKAGPVRENSRFADYWRRPVRSRLQNRFPLKFVSGSKRSNSENRT